MNLAVQIALVVAFVCYALALAGRLFLPYDPDCLRWERVGAGTETMIIGKTLATVPKYEHYCVERRVMPTP